MLLLSLLVLVLAQATTAPLAQLSRIWRGNGSTGGGGAWAVVRGRPRPLQEAYPIFWAVQGNQAAAFDANGSVNVQQWGIKPNNVQCGGLTGHWPTLDAGMNPLNGGVPQNANLTLLLAELGAEIDRLIPDQQWEGLGSFDFEAWAPIWEENTAWAGKPVLGPYQNYSVQLVRAAHSTWPADRIEKQAKAEFEAAATALFVAALNHASALRPKVLWGFCNKRPANPHTVRMHADFGRWIEFRSH